MGPLDLMRLPRAARLAAAAFVLAAASPAAAQTNVKFSLDGRVEGPAGLFLLPQDRGYYKAAGLDVTIDEAASALESITRVASGGYDMAFADINALIKYRDQNPSTPIKAVFMVYNKPPYAIVARKSRGITEPKQLEGKKLGAPPTSSTFGQWPLFAKLNGIDVSKVTIENIATRCARRCWPPDSSTPCSASRSGSTSTSRTAACRSTTSCCCRWRTTASSSTATRSS